MIIVSGANGFVGRYLIKALVDYGKTVIAVGKSSVSDNFFNNLGVEYMRLDCSIESEFKILPNKNIEAFVHLAALIPSRVVIERNEKYFEVNTIGTKNSINFCLYNNIKKFIYSTTLYEVIGHNSLLINEKMGRSYSLTGDHSLYVVSKIAAADIVQHYTEEYGMQGIILRFTGLLGYGRQEGYWKNGVFLPSAFEVFYNNCNQGSALEVWGKHKSVKDSLYVKDAVSAILQSLASPTASGVYGIGSGIGRTNLDDANSFVQVFNSFGKEIDIVFKPDIPEKTSSYVFDISKARKELDWSPEYSFEEIIRDYDKEVKLGIFKAS